VTAVGGLGWALWIFRILIFDFRFGGRRRGDAVRAEAGRWLGKLRKAEGGVRNGEARGCAVVADLQRLRFGARETWGNPVEIFRRARQGAKGRWATTT
jgi:hypothetical protein